MLFKERESATLEFKRMLPSKNQIVKTVIGFVNLFGGRLIIGIDDDREIVGIEEKLAEQLLESISQSIVRQCSPTLLPSVYLHRIEDKILVVIEVSAGLNKPYFVTSKRVEKGTYVRSGTQTILATPEIIHQLQWMTQGRSVDWMPVYSARLEDLDCDAFTSFLKRRRYHFQSGEVERMLENYHLVQREHGHVQASIAGVMLFGKDPQYHLTESFTICTHFEGLSGRKALAARDCMGTLFQQYEEVLSFLRLRLHRSFEITNAGKRKEQLEIPEDALREVILNALVHRDYSIPGPTKVAIFDDRVEVHSPGNFPGPIGVDKLEMGITYLRNVAICKVFREAQYIEKLGSGFLTLFQVYRERALPRPEVVEGHGFVKVILPRPSGKHKVSQDAHFEGDILQLFRYADEIRMADVLQYVKISRTTAGRILSKMREQGLLIRTGTGPNTRYHRCDT